MIKSVSVLNSYGDLLELKVEGLDADSARFIIYSIEGLSPPKATINTIGGPFDGATINSTTVGVRNIVINLSIPVTGKEEEDARTDLYRYFPVKSKVLLTIETTSKTTTIEAAVEACDVQMFARLENATISLICARPFLQGLSQESLVFSGTIDEFTFPFSNESLTENLIIFGSIIENITQFLNYTGDERTGVVITLHARGIVHNISFYNLTTGEIMPINTDLVSDIVGSSALVEGDDITIDTRVGMKRITLLRNGIEYNIFNSLPMHNQWISLIPGINELSFTAAMGSEYIDASVVWYPLYHGA